MSKLTPSKQDYLEAILDLSVQGAPVRSIDVANALGFSRASVSRAIGLLRAYGFLLQQPYGGITLTDLGRREAIKVRRRHDLLKYYLIHILLVPEEIAEEDACRMEHVVSSTTLEQIEAAATQHMKEFHGGR